MFSISNLIGDDDGMEGRFDEYFKDEMSEWRPSSADDDPLLSCLRQTSSDLQGSSSSQKSLSLLQPTCSTDPTDSCEFEFAWCHLMGKRVPSLDFGGEASVPLEVITDMLKLNPNYDDEMFHAVMKSRAVFIRLATLKQAMLLQQYSTECSKKSMINMTMIRRSDLERVLGELRIESQRTGKEHDYWNPNERLLICHFNFCDHVDDYLEHDDDEDEDVYRAASIGWFYPSRAGMRNIRCVDCDGKFLPADFALHHHLPPKYDGIYHWGLSSNNWCGMLAIVPSYSKAYKTIWQQAVNKGTAGMKRRMDLQKGDAVYRQTFEQATLIRPKKKLLNNGMELDEDEEIIEIVDRDEDIALSTARAAALKKAEEIERKSIPKFVEKPVMKLPPLDIAQLSKLAQQMAGKLPAIPPMIVPNFGMSMLNKPGIQLGNVVAKKLSPYDDVLQKKAAQAGWNAVLKEQEILKSLSDEAIQALNAKTVMMVPPIPPPSAFQQALPCIKEPYPGYFDQLIQLLKLQISTPLQPPSAFKVPMVPNLPPLAPIPSLPPLPLPQPPVQQITSKFFENSAQFGGMNLLEQFRLLTNNLAPAPPVRN